jgi:hypothetical protein
MYRTDRKSTLEVYGMIRERLMPRLSWCNQSVIKIGYILITSMFLQDWWLLQPLYVYCRELYSSGPLEFVISFPLRSLPRT